MKNVSQVHESISVDQLIEKLQYVALDVNTYYKHAKRGTLQQYYNLIITQTVFEIVFIPLNAAKEQIEINKEDAEAILANDFPRITATIASMFSKDQRAVAHDIIKALETCPVQDIKMAFNLRQNNMLH